MRRGSRTMKQGLQSHRSQSTLRLQRQPFFSWSQCLEDSNLQDFFHLWCSVAKIKIKLNWNTMEPKRFRSYLNNPIDVVKWHRPSNNGHESWSKTKPSQENRAGMKAEAEKTVESHPISHAAIRSLVVMREIYKKKKTQIITFASSEIRDWFMAIWCEQECWSH